MKKGGLMQRLIKIVAWLVVAIVVMFIVGMRLGLWHKVWRY